MRRITLFVLSLALIAPLAVGCGEKKSEPVASGDELQEFLADNPDVVADVEEEEEMAAADDTDEE